MSGQHVFSDRQISEATLPCPTTPPLELGCLRPAFSVQVAVQKVPTERTTATVVSTIVLFLNFGATVSTQACGQLDMKLSCDVTRKAVAPSLSYHYERVRKIDLRFCFDNKGGHNEDMARIEHIEPGSDENITPLTWFNIVRFSAREVDNKITWVGTNPLTFYPTSAKLASIRERGVDNST